MVGPARHDAVVDQMDVRPGGSWRFVIENSDGFETAFRGTYREVTPPERIVQTFEWEGMPGHVAVETATFEDLGERTRVVTTSLFHTTEERDGMLGSGMESGRTRPTSASTSCSRGSPRADPRARYRALAPGVGRVVASPSMRGQPWQSVFV